MHSILDNFVYHLHTIPNHSFLIKLTKKSSSFAYVHSLENLPAYYGYLDSFTLTIVRL